MSSRTTSLAAAILAATVLATLPTSVGCGPGAGPRGGLIHTGHVPTGRKGTPWTIQCLQLPGQNGAIRIEQLAEVLRQTEGIRPREVFVRHDGDASKLYYGEYWRSTDKETNRPKPNKQMRADLGLIGQLGVMNNGMQARLFLGALPVRMPQDDVGDPAWNLSRAEGTYTLQVGVFEPADGFWQYKQAAADFCAQLRKEGFEAYYYHTNTSSMVTVGCYGPEALITQEIARPGMPSAWKTRYAPEVKQLQRHEFLKYNLLNGKIYRIITDDGTSVPVLSRLVEIPNQKKEEQW